MDFTIYKVKSAKILMKSKDLSGFQGTILQVNYKIQNYSNVNGLNHTNQTIFVYVQFPLYINPILDYCNNTMNTPLDHQIYQTIQI